MEFTNDLQLYKPRKTDTKQATLDELANNADKLETTLGNIAKKSVNFDFTALSPSFYTNLSLFDTTVLQCFVINEKTNEIYATQQANSPADVSQSFYLNRLTMDGKLIDQMHLIHGGHGTTFGIENAADGVYIWSAYDQVDAGKNPIGNDLVRFKYVGGAEYDETNVNLVRYNQLTNSRYVRPTIDQKNNTILFCCDTPEVIELRNLNDVKNGVNNILASFTIPSDLQTTLQGLSHDEYDLYWYTGDVNSQTNPNRITVFDINTGTIKKQLTVDFGYSPDGTYEESYREPEGIYLYTEPNTGAKSLFAGVVTGEANRRIRKIYAYHSLGNESKFIGNRTQSFQHFKLTEKSGAGKRLPTYLTKLSDYRIPGQYYMTTAETANYTDHPQPNVAGWFFEVTATDTAGGVIQRLTRSTTIKTNARKYERMVSGDGLTASPWELTYAGGSTDYVNITTGSNGATPVSLSVTDTGTELIFRGLVTIPASFPAAGTLIFTLPTGIESPSKGIWIQPVFPDIANPSQFGWVAMARINTDGTVSFYKNPNQNVDTSYGFRFVVKKY